MSAFANAVVQGATTTTNGMSALKNTGDALTNLFFGIGAARNDPNKAVTDFIAAFNVDRLNAMKLLFWARDVRGGAGERQTFRNILSVLEVSQPNVVIKNLHLIPKFGRWDDMLVFTTRDVQTAAFKIISDTLLNQTDGWQLCSKWMPRKGPIAAALRSYMGLSPKAYRKMLVNGTNVVETAMCAKDWTGINYEHVPSVAARNYQSAFSRHDEAGYAAYRSALTKGTAKINASAIFPHDVIRGTDDAVADAQWKSLPNYFEGSTTKMLPMIDVSGSMGSLAGPNNDSLSCMDIAISLGLYVAEKQTGPFGGLYLTFTDQPVLTQTQGGSIKEKFDFIRHHNVGYNTNIQKAYEEILRVATVNRVAPEDMPRIIIVFSDMQFDQATVPAYGDRPQFNYNPTAQQMAEKLFNDAGYLLPTIVYWNLDAAPNVPVAFDECGTALVSGFSPAIMKSIIAADLSNITPFRIMMDAIGSGRYDEVTI